MERANPDSHSTWHSHNRTARGTFTPTRILVRSSSFMFGFIFFGLFPIGSRYPKYRLLASPIKWLLWNIISHAEWSIISLQAEAKRHKYPTSGPQDPSNAQREPDIGGYRGPPTIADGTPLVPPPPPTTSALGEDYGSYS
ncbi:hypothetical protein B0O99DRAFT_145229 [Bisporella sp. PMI_857]|nr:hypothetical protein B0O99DRAFT_145229 [Bisporella sp. PMI_857]